MSAWIKRHMADLVFCLLVVAWVGARLLNWLVARSVLDLSLPKSSRMGGALLMYTSVYRDKFRCILDRSFGAVH